MISESNADYHANRAISHSKLECYRRRPALFYKRFVLQMLPPPKESNALRIGSAAHCAILEEQAFLERYVVLPDIDRRTKEGKALFAEFSAQHAGKTYLTEDELDQLMQMRIAVEAHPIAGGCNAARTGGTPRAAKRAMASRTWSTSRLSRAWTETPFGTSSGRCFRLGTIGRQAFTSHSLTSCTTSRSRGCIT